MKNLIQYFIVAFVIAAKILNAQSYHYVSKNGNNSNGDSWINAWDELDQIEWNSIHPGDAIFIDGGIDSMIYETRIIVGAGGSDNQNRITIQRSEEGGHSGKIFLNGIYCDYPYITLDGIERDKFIIIGNDWGYIVRTTENANWFEFKNSLLRCTFVSDSGAWGIPMLNHSPHVLVKSCGFEGTNIEDQIRYDGSGTCIIEDSYFIGISNHGDIHEDICQTYTDSMDTLIVRRNIFVASYNDYFMLGNTEFDYVEFSYNVFTATPEYGGDAIKGNSANLIIVCNNVFDKCRDILGMNNNSQLIRNNIYTGIGPWNGDVHVSSGTQYSLWDVDVTFFENGNGNIQLLTGEPLFLGKENLLGEDNMPFTNDDGFCLLEGSPAINNGIGIGYSFDIMGNQIIDAPDIGAYEYTSTTSVEDENTVTDFKLYQNYPNPFNPTTNIQYAISSGQFVTLKVYDVLGNEVVALVNEYKPAGHFIINFDASGLASSVYIYQLIAGNYIQTRKMVLLR